MYNVKVDENYFYQNVYAKIGKVEGGIDMPTLPPEENSLCYYIAFVNKVEIKQVPAKAYFKSVTSETEFDITYELKSVDENGDETTTIITEEEYNVLSDEDRANVTVTQIPKVAQVELTKAEYNALSDEEKAEIYITNKLDEDNNQVYEDVEETVVVKEWAFSQAKFEELEAQRIADEAAEAEQKEEEEYFNDLPIHVRQARADIDYISLMSGIYLDDAHAIATLDEHSAKFPVIKTYYDTGLWSKSRVYNMVDKNIITAEEYQMITAEEYK